MSVDIRDNLKMVIREKGYSQAAIAYKANLTPSKLSMVLNKERKLEANEMFSICNAIEMSPMELKDFNKQKLPEEKGGV